MVDQPLSVPQQLLPEGQFLLPLCVTKADVQNLLDGMLYARYLFDPNGENLEYMYPLWEGLAFTQTPGLAPCVASTPEPGGCTDYSTASAILSFAPQDPRINPEFVPDCYNFPPFYFQPGTTRIITSLERIPISNNPLCTPEDARFRVSFTGEGVVELHLVAVLFGGYGLITVDGNPLSLITAELNLDEISVPPETNQIVIIEVPVEGTGAHYIDVTFAPRINDEAPLITYGGGIEKVVLCGEDIHGDTEMATLRFKRKPVVGDYTLQIKVGNGEWLDTEYNFVGSPILATTIQPDVVDENGIIVGTVGVTHDGNPIEDQVVRNIYTVQLNRAAFQGEPGKDGEGTPGEDGHNVAVLDPALQGVLNPNQDPDIIVDNALPTTTFVGFKLPRAAVITKDDDIVRKPNESPTVAMSSTTEGDKRVQFGLPRAQKIVSASAHAIASGNTPTVGYTENTDGDLIQSLGIPAPADGVNGFDTVLPALGEEKIFSMLVLADTITNLPFRVPAGSIISNVSADGYWSVFDTSDVRSVGMIGVIVDGQETGRLDLGRKTNQTEGNFSYSAAQGVHTFDEDTWVSFAQHRAFPTEYGGGWLLVTYTLSRPSPTTINLTYELGGSGVDSVETGEEFDFIIGANGGFYNANVIFDVPVILELISVTGWTQGPYIGATWDFTRGNNTYGGYFAAPVDVPDESALEYGVNSATLTVVRLKATIA